MVFLRRFLPSAARIALLLLLLSPLTTSSNWVALLSSLTLTPLTLLSSLPVRSLSLCKFYTKLCVPGETAGE
jgi:hypothetical protein